MLVVIELDLDHCMVIACNASNLTDPKL